MWGGEGLGHGAASVKANPVWPLSLKEGTKLLCTIWCVSWDWRIAKDEESMMHLYFFFS